MASLPIYEAKRCVRLLLLQRSPQVSLRTLPSRRSITLSSGATSSCHHSRTYVSRTASRPVLTHQVRRLSCSQKQYQHTSVQVDTSAKPFYVTTPIFYVNADPHIGHLHSSLIADVLSRYHTIRRGGYSKFDNHGNQLSQQAISHTLDTLGSTTAVLSTGTDEHGLKIQKVAEAAGQDPKSLCDRVSKRFKDLADVSNIGYTTFIRTTEKAHRDAVHHLWRQLEQKGYIYKGSHEGWYAVSDEAFYPEGQVRQAVDQNTGEKYMESIETGAKVEWSSEENYKFRLSAFQQALIDWLEANPKAIRPAIRYDEVLKEIKMGLSDLSISRPSSRLSWGIQVPDDPDHSIYVWMDALTNYITVTGYPWTNRESANHAWPADVQVVGKDIIRFHTIYWPAFLLAAGLPLPKTILAHSHWTMNKAKMSKSRGNVANPFEAISTFGLDTVRFFLMRVGGNFASDSDYTPSVLLEYHRKFLQGQLGNLLSRISAPKIQFRLASFEVDPLTGTIQRLPSSVTIPLLDQDTQKLLSSLEQSLITLPTRFDELMENYEFSKALELVLEDTIGHANELMQRLEPWSSTTREEIVLESVLIISETLRICATLLQPFMPDKMNQLLDVLQVEPNRRNDWKSIVQLDKESRLILHVKPRDPNLEKVKPLFPRLEIDN